MSRSRFKKPGEEFTHTHKLSLRSFPHHPLVLHGVHYKGFVFEIRIDLLTQTTRVFGSAVTKIDFN